MVYHLPRISFKLQVGLGDPVAYFKITIFVKLDKYIKSVL